jgi:hypothetical protein
MAVLQDYILSRERIWPSTVAMSSLFMGAALWVRLYGCGFVWWGPPFFFNGCQGRIAAADHALNR